MTEERVEAFVVACARGRAAVLAAVGARLLDEADAAALARAWGEGWRRSAGEGAEEEVGEAVVAALLGAYPEGAKEKNGVVRPPRLHTPPHRPHRAACVRERSHSLAPALRSMGSCRCTGPRPARRRRRW